MSRGRPPIVIFGDGTLARLARAYFERDSDHEVVAFTVDRERLSTSQDHGVPIVPFDEAVDRYPASDFALFVAVGYTRVNRARAEIVERCQDLGYHLPTLVSSRASTWDDLRTGANCLVFDGAVIEPGVELGDGVIMWSGSQISHDCTIGDHCFLGPAAVVLGDVSIGPRCFVGGNATIRNGVNVAPDCIVGAGAVIKASTAPGEVFAEAATAARAGARSSEVVL